MCVCVGGGEGHLFSLKIILVNKMIDGSVYHIVGRESKTCIFDFHIFQERQLTG